MGTPIEVGMTNELRRRVTIEDTADRFGNRGVMVLATPMLVALIEQAAIGCVADSLDAGQGTVGTRIDVKHLAATPVGMEVTIRVRLAAVEGRKLTFAVEAADEREPIAEGVHERFIISTSRFLERVAAKGAQHA